MERLNHEKTLLQKERAKKSDNKASRGTEIQYDLSQDVEKVLTKENGQLYSFSLQRLQAAI